MGHHHDEEDVAPATEHPNYIGNILQQRLSRRQALLGGLSASGLATLSSMGLLGLTGCASNNETTAPNNSASAPKLSFTPIAKSVADLCVVPTGYSASVLYALGDPIATGIAAYSNDGTQDDFDKRAGDHHDGMYYFGLGDDGKFSFNRSDRGLLCMNHEAITQTYLHTGAASAAPRNLAEVRKEMNCHGVSVIEIRKNAAGRFEVVQDSPFNRRITPFTEMEISGPVRNSKFIVTKFAKSRTHTRGTVNNCANGYTPWGTYLTCEENWNGYFRRTSTTGFTAAELSAHTRYGTTSTSGRHLWTSATGAGEDIMHFDMSIPDAAQPATNDFRNEPNTYGWVVEIDPFNPASTPKKRTTMGRFGHEGAWPARFTAGKPVVFYMGDDRQNDYIYKFVSNKNYNPADTGLAAGDKYLDDGVLYVATYKADGTGEWKALVHGSNGLNEDNALYPFTSQAAVLVNTRLAADSVGATKMDRPEWAAVNPLNGEVYLTLTNNSNRSVTDPANPRRYSATGTPGTGGNVNGHIIRWREDSDDPTATTFKWDVYLFGSRAAYTDPAINASGLTAENDFSSPDGLWFDPRGVLWIQTDDGAYTQGVPGGDPTATNCMMLAASPGAVGDGGARTLNGQGTFVGKNATADDVRRFFVGPVDCEITGVDITPDGRTMFVNVQHPGEGGTLAAPISNWPSDTRNALAIGTAGARPRSATVVITRDDGGIIAL